MILNQSLKKALPLMATEIEVGNPLMLHVQLGSGNTGKYIQATLRDENGSILVGSPVSLTDQGDGLYSDTSYFMPNIRFVVVTYIVYDDSGHTTITDSDDFGTDLFIRKDISEALVRNDSITGFFEMDSGTITASLSSAGTVSGSLLSETASVNGVVGSYNTLSGQIHSTDNSITADIARC